MPTNMSEHGWSHGVHQANRSELLQDILNDVIEHGRNLTQEKLEQDIRDGLEKALGDFDFTDVDLDDNDELVRRLFEHALETLYSINVVSTCMPKALHSGERELVQELVDAYSTEDGWDIDEVYGLVTEWVNHNCESPDECVYLHTFDEDGVSVTIEASCLGGAYLLFIQDSPFLTSCSVCSPCVPNAGDLDSPCSGQESKWDHWTSRWAYCLPLSWFTEAGEPIPYITVRPVKGPDAGDICYHKEQEDD